MQTVSANFTAATNANARQVRSYLEIAWDGTGLIAAARGGAGWVDESAYLVAHSGALKINPPGEDLVPAGQVGTASITLDNATQRFSWLRADMPLYAYIGGVNGFVGIKVRLWEGFVVPDGVEYVCVFTGAITGWQPKTATAEVRLECADIGWLYLQNKLSSALFTNYLPDEWIAYVAETLGGMAAADMDLSAGIYQIPWLWLDDESIVEEIWEAAGADGGLAYFDQRGKLLYRNPLAWVGLTSVWDFTEARYEQAEPRIDAAAVASKIIVEWNTRHEDAPLELYSVKVPKLIPPNGSLSWTARFDHCAVEVYAPTSAEPHLDYHLSGMGGVDLTSQVTVTLSNISGQQCTVTVTNTSPTYIAQMEYLHIRGIPLVGGPTEQNSATPAVDPFGGSFTRTRTVRGNPYCQTLSQANALANLLAVRCARVRPIYALRGVPGVPQLELGDRVTFYDHWAITGNVKDSIVTGIEWEATEQGFTQKLELMDLTDLAQYDNYFIIGVTALGDHGRCWY